MFISKLKSPLKECAFLLNKDEEFQKRFQTDPILDKLYDEQYDPALCYIELTSTLNGKLEFDEQEFSQIRLLQYIWLWCVGNPLVKAGKDIEEADLDLFFYTLEHEFNPCDSILKIMTVAFGEIKRRNLTKERAEEIAKSLIGIGFHPLSMFPATNGTGNEQPMFDADWMTGIISKVHVVTGLLPKEIEKMSMSACCFYFIQWCRMQGDNHIMKRTPEEILKAISKRTDELIAERLIELGQLKEEDKLEFLNIIGTPPENK